MKTQPELRDFFQVTEAHNHKIQIVVKDRDSDQILCLEWITKGLLAKLFHESKVIGSHNGLFMIER